MIHRILRAFLLPALLLVPAFARAEDPAPAPPNTAAAAAATEAPAAAEATPEVAPAQPGDAVAPSPAQAAAPTPPPGYERVSGAGKAQAPIEAPPLVVISYGVIWLLTLIYLLFLWRKQAGLRAEIDALQARLDALES